MRSHTDENCGSNFSNVDSSDLLGQLRNAAERNQERTVIESRSSSELLWDPHFSRNSTYSISDISMSTRIANSGRTLQGWKVVDKKRIYTTYRNGKLVQGEGAEAFKLSMGDAPRSKAKKRGSTEITKCDKSEEMCITSPYRTNDSLRENEACVHPSSQTNFYINDESKRIKTCYQETSNRNGEFDFCFS